MDTPATMPDLRVVALHADDVDDAGDLLERPFHRPDYMAAAREGMDARSASRSTHAVRCSSPTISARPCG
jgi:hypothetical protein